MAGSKLSDAELYTGTMDNDAVRLGPIEVIGFPGKFAAKPQDFLQGLLSCSANPLRFQGPLLTIFAPIPADQPDPDPPAEGEWQLYIHSDGEGGWEWLIAFGKPGGGTVYQHQGMG